MSETPPDPSPFDLSPRSPSDGDAAVLCLHGLTGTPYEVRPIAEAVAAAGLRARGPVLPGHDTTPEELAEIPYRVWLDAVRAEFKALRAEHERVYVAGLSLGGLLTLMLTAAHDVAAAAVVGTPLRFRSPVPAVVPLVRRFYRMMPKRQGSDIADEQARARHPGYRVMPMPSVHELIRLQRVVRARLGRVRAPLLVAHGRNDRTADPRDLETIASGVASTELEKLYLEHSAHVVPVDHDGARLSEAIAEFFTRKR